ncbi:MAG: PSD1 and planctomycete cytochrome C domain-containing protein [Chthonomonadales bacterium]
MNRSYCRTLLVLGPLLPLIVGATASVGSPTPKQTPDAKQQHFTKVILPLLQKRCLGCHGVDAKLGGLDLRTRTAALKGGTHGPAFVPGSGATSRIYQLITGQRNPVMPPGGKLPPAEAELLKKWIDDSGVYVGEPAKSATKQVWWSFKKPVMPTIPRNANAKSTNPIDAFVLAKLTEQKLTPSPRAPRAVLIRRAFLDLVGLPPTPEEIQAFERDTSPKAWEKVIDRLLDSPQYGERWARHWLDIVRYADSGGFEGDKDRPLAYRYRDYVIQSFNADKPYTDFLKEQIAGDEWKPKDRNAVIATGYLAAGPQDIVMQNVKNRADELDDLVSTTGAALLGLTIGCARCHDHKYDPVKQTDYYRLSAIFAPTERREMDIPTPEEQASADKLNEDIDFQIKPLQASANTFRAVANAAGKKPGALPDDQVPNLLPEKDRATFNNIVKQINALEAKRPKLPKAYAVTDKSSTFGKCFLLLRGDAEHRGPEVQPGFIASLPGGESDVHDAGGAAATTGRRTALANWIASEENPLTARVFMNRVWRQHFGRGICNTPSNVGINGEYPTHPELLDWLAVTFVRGGWKLKPIHKMILMSDTWQQASAIRKEAVAVDPLNKLFWRMNVRRLEAEAIRDSILTVAGSLNTEMFGPPVYPPVDPTLRADTFQGINWPEGEDSPKTWRRSIYVKVKRSLLLPQLEVFDCPEISTSVAQRNTTTTPLQALMLLNDPLILRQASLFADRLKREVGDDPRKQIDRAYWLATGRSPNAVEVNSSLTFLKTHPLGDFAQAIFNLNEFVYAR